MSHKNYSELRKAILQKAKESMKDDVLVHVKNKMIDAIESEVYDVNPRPRRYEQRRLNDGLLDRDNIEGNAIRRVDPNGFDYRIDNVTMTNFNGRPQVYLTPLVVLGQLGAKAAGYSGDYLYYEHAEKYPYGQPRDFISETIDNLDERTIAELLKSGMTMR